MLEAAKSSLFVKRATSSLKEFRFCCSDVYKRQHIHLPGCLCYHRHIGIIHRHLGGQNSTLLGRIISQADYEYLKRRLWEDEEYTYYFIVRFMAATGVRISELVKFQVEDVLDGFKDIYSKGNKMRRVYIPITLRKAALQ